MSLETLGTAANILGLADFAGELIKVALETYQFMKCIRDAPKSFSNYVVDFNAVILDLESTHSLLNKNVTNAGLTTRGTRESLARVLVGFTNYLKGYRELLGSICSVKGVEMGVNGMVLTRNKVRWWRKEKEVEKGWGYIKSFQSDIRMLVQSLNL
ncbi:hypothetical protein ABW19_dt0209748 [Dactylella cylindrospora]|nr:hypothetical protein ABW19_dt0209748 [Dactylella cylindrospora]